MNCSPPGFSGHGILRARIQEQVVKPSSRESSRPRNPTHVSCISSIGRSVPYHKHHLGSSFIDQFISVAQSGQTLCNSMNHSAPGLPVHHQLPESTQTHVHWVMPSNHLILSSPSPPALNLFQHQGLFKWVSSSNQVAKVLEFQLQYQSFQWRPRTDLLKDGLVRSPCSPRDSQESSPTPQFKSINSLVLCFLYSPTSHPYMTIGKTIALTRRTFVDKVMSLLLNMLSRLVVTLLPRSKQLLISWLQSPSAVILELPPEKSATVSTISPSICHEVMGPDAMILVFWMLSFKPTFSLSFTFINRLLNSSSLSAKRVVSSAYLKLLMFLPATLISACVSSSPEFLLMYSAYKLNKHGDNIQPWHTPFSIWNQFVVPCPVLTVASWPAYRFLKRQVRYSGIPKILSY